MSCATGRRNTGDDEGDHAVSGGGAGLLVLLGGLALAFGALTAAAASRWGRCC
jgi:hypothetical protein